MKITFVTNYLTIFGGGGKIVMDFSNELIERGHQINVVAQKINHENYRFKDEVSTFEVGGPLLSNPFRWLRFHNIKHKYLKILNEIEKDILISVHFPANYICAEVKNRNKFKHIYYCLEPYRFIHGKKFQYKASFFIKIVSRIISLFFKKYDIKGTLDADEIICISRFIINRVKEVYNREGTLHYLGVEIEDAFKIQNDFNLRRQLNIKNDTPIILSLGFTHHMKGAKELIEIFHKILKELPETVLLIGGWITKKNQQIMKKLIKKLNISSQKVIFYGFIGKEFLNCIYKTASLTFFTAIEESFGLIPLESMLNGTPVIAFNSGGPSETIIHGQTGFLIKLNDYKDFAQKAINIIKNKELREKLSTKAKEHIKRSFNIEKSVSSLEILFQKFIAK